MDKAKLGNFIMRVFRGGEDNHDHPNHHVCFKWYPYPDEPKFYEQVILNSEIPADQVWLGNSGRWYKFYDGPEFRRLAAWVFWRWAWGDWFGLKNKLWCYGLHLATHDMMREWRKATQAGANMDSPLDGVE